MEKAMLFIVVLLTWLAVSAIGVYATQNIIVSDRTVSERQGALQVNGVLPELSGLTNSVFQAEINLLIRQELDDKIETARKDLSRRVDVKYEYKNDNEYHSIVIRISTAAASVRDEVRTFVFDSGSRLLTVNDVLGINGTKIINQVIELDIARNPGKFSPGFSGIAAEQSFYIEDGVLVVIFDKYAIGPAAVGTPEFPVNIESVTKNTFAIPLDDTYAKEPYNVRMIPLRAVARGIGFDVAWNPIATSINIMRLDNRAVVVASMTIDENLYFKGMYAGFTLEYAPELRDNTTYLPISFFERILDACYTIDQAGSIITFSHYQAPAQ